MRNSRNLGPPIVYSLWETVTVANYSTGPLCLKPVSGLRSVTPGTTDSQWYCWICAFHRSNCPNYSVGLTGRGICTATFATSGVTTAGRQRCRHICVALHWIYCKRRHAAITKSEKESLCFVLSLSLKGQSGQWRVSDDIRHGTTTICTV